MTEDWRTETRLPDDPAYWDDLAARSIDAAWQRARTAETTTPWWRGVSDGAFLFAASAVLALLGGALLLDAPASRTASQLATPATSHAAVIADALAPDDPLLRTLLNAGAEPQAGALLRLVALREEGR